MISISEPKFGVIIVFVPLLLEGLDADADAPGAWPKGTRVVKAWNEPGDMHGLGAPATVRGSVDREEYPVAIELETGEVVYCVEWDDAPGKPVFCRGKKLARAE
jgi:hypothetical protein